MAKFSEVQKSAREFSHGLNMWHVWPLKSRPCEKSLSDFCTSAHLKGLKINLLHPQQAQKGFWPISARWGSYGIY